MDGIVTDRMVTHPLKAFSLILTVLIGRRLPQDDITN